MLVVGLCNRHFNYDKNLDLVIPSDVLDVNPEPGQLVELNSTGSSFLGELFDQFSVVRGRRVMGCCAAGLLLFVCARSHA